MRPCLNFQISNVYSTQELTAPTFVVHVMNSLSSILKSISSHVTLVAATIAAIVAIWVKIDDARHQTALHEITLQQETLKTKADDLANHTTAIENSLKGIEVRERTENASYKFADEFLAYIKQNPDQFKTGSQVAIAALSIIADASSDEGGLSDPVARRAMPVKMALILNDAGSVVAMDPSLKLIDKWWDSALWADDDAVQVTAIKALSAICRRALQDETATNLPLAVTCLVRIDALRRRFQEKEVVGGYALILPSDKEAADRTASDRHKLEALTEVSLIYSDVRNSYSPDADGEKGKIGAYLLAAYGDFQQRQTSFKIATQAGPSEQTGEKNANQEALTNANKVVDTVQSSIEREKPENDGQVNERIRTLTKNLADSADEVRHRARTELALQGQDAVKPLLREVTGRLNTKTDEDYKTLLGVAVALSRMRQPIALDREDANLAVQLLGVKDAQTRLAASDFLMNLESPGSLEFSFQALQKFFLQSKNNSPPNGNAVYNAAVVMATWARVITPETKIAEAPEKGIKSMRELSQSTAKEWQKVLKEQSQGYDWAKTISVIDELLRKINASP